MDRRTFGIIGGAALLLTMACGGSDDGTPTSPSGGSGGPVAATITISAAGVASPRDVTVAAGSRVTFVNNHSQAHEMFSDPHPEHTACPALNTVGRLNPGDSRTSGNLNTPGTCGFHDHIAESNENLKGTIRIQ